MRLKPGGNRELHWRGTAAEWTFVITENRARPWSIPMENIILYHSTSPAHRLGL